MASLVKLRMKDMTSMCNTLNFATKCLKSLEIDCYYSSDEDITPLITYIKYNERHLQTVIISDYHISEQFFALICNYLDLKQLSICCKHLSLSYLIQILSKTQNNLSFVVLNELNIEDISMDSNRY